MIEERFHDNGTVGQASTRRLMAVASIVPEAHPSDGVPSDDQVGAASELVGEALSAHLAPPAAHFPGADGEFVCIFPDLAGAQASANLESTRRALRNEPAIANVMVSFSAGLAVNDLTQDREKTLDTARQLRMDAQQKGGDRVQVQAEAPAERPTILLAEDDTLTARLIIHRLEREGYNVVHHPDGQSAFDAAHDATYALAILDVKMPRMDGFELLGRIKEDPELASTPVVMLTGMGAEQDVVRALSGGADDYILKPFSPTELALRVQRLLAS